ncbi:MAG: sugar ABC transporter substrate-binding protein [Lachnospiraceae bacterium]|nr:sugar ABC transporter substrate-binding protein [Lachnospiraceae bacterium]
MKWKKVCAAALCLAMAGSLAACGGSSGSAGSSGSSGGSSDGALVVNIWDANQQAGIQEICNDWTALGNPKVNVEVIDWDNYWTLLEAGASGGDLPDVFWMHSNYAQIYMENDILLDLTDYVEKDGIDMGMYYEDIASMFTRSDGKIFALPKDHDTIALLYNKKLFDEAGVEYPTNDWTYEDMYNAAKAITEGTADDTYGYALNTSNDQDGWFNYIYSYGGNIINEDKTDTGIDSAESKAGMEMCRKMLTVATPQSVVAESGTDSLFVSGKVGMITQGSWMINTFYTAENSADYAWAEIPYCDRNGDGKCQKEERQSCYNGLGWAADAATNRPDECASLIEYLCSKDAQLKQAKLGITMAGIPSISEEFANAFEGMDVSAFTDIETDGTLFVRPGTRNSGKWQDPMKQAGGFLDAFQNPTDEAAMSTACDNVAKMIRDAIAEDQ